MEKNILPFDGSVIYFQNIISELESEELMDKFMIDIHWRHDESKIFGKHFITKRKVAWYGDNNCQYTYSGTSKTALPWTKELLHLKTIVEEYSKTKFNSCLLNLYHNGDEGMGWHSDDEKSLGKDIIIASISLGAERRFLFKHRILKDKIEILLQNGSLLIMKGATQINWMHSLPKTKKSKHPRINLTFRTILH